MNSLLSDDRFDPAGIYVESVRRKKHDVHKAKHKYVVIYSTVFLLE